MASAPHWQPNRQSTAGAKRRYRRGESRKPKPISIAKGAGLAVLIGIAAGGAYLAAPDLPAASRPTCTIKGNISANGHIYHVPRGEFYSETMINTARGERWFCSEEVAQAAGWRRSLR